MTGIWIIKQTSYWVFLDLLFSTLLGYKITCKKWLILGHQKARKIVSDAYYQSAWNEALFKDEFGP